MFEPPVYPATEFYGTGRRETEKSFYVGLEKEEIERLRQDKDFEPAHVRPQIRKKRRRKADSARSGDSEGVLEYTGLLSGARYDADGNVISGTSESRIFDAASKTRHGNQFAHVRKLQTFYNYGLEELPRPPSPARVVRDSPGTARLCEQLTERSRTILGKNTDAQGTTVLPVAAAAADGLAEDTWPHRALRVRHASVLNAILQLALLRRDYGLARRAFALLIRTPGVDIRALWTIGLELLVQQRAQYDAQQGLLDPSADSRGLNNGDLHTLPHSYARRFDEEFLEWLVVNYPRMPHVAASQWRRERPRAPEFLPYLILSLLRHGSAKDALSRLEELMLEAAFSENAVFQALCGIATMQLMAQIRRQHRPGGREEVEQLHTKAQDYFSRCIEYGGTLPEDLLSSELEALMEDEPPEQDHAGSPQASASDYSFDEL